MYIVEQTGYSRLEDVGAEALPAVQIAATQPGAGGAQAVGLVLAFFSTLLIFTSIMAGGDR